MGIGRNLRARKKVDYAKVIHRYDKFDFIAPSRQRQPRMIPITSAQGRANAAPPLTSWPFQGIHQDVTYYDDIKKNLL